MTDAVEIDLNRQLVIIHSACTHWKPDPKAPVRCRGFAIQFPTDQEPVMVPVVGLSAHHSAGDNKVQNTKFIALREGLRRAKARRFVNFRIKMQVKVKMIDEDCPRYQQLWAECLQLMADLRVEYQFVGRRTNKTSTEVLVDEKALYASRIQYRFQQFPPAWLDESVMSEILKQPFLPAFKETVQMIKKELGWVVPDEVQKRYSDLGFQFYPSFNDYEDDSDDEDSEGDDSEEDEESQVQRKRPSSRNSHDSATKKIRTV